VSLESGNQLPDLNFCGNLGSIYQNTTEQSFITYFGEVNLIDYLFSIFSIVHPKINRKCYPVS